MTDSEIATIREVIAPMRERARLQIGQHEAIHRADIAKLEAPDHETAGGMTPMRHQQQVEGGRRG